MPIPNWDLMPDDDSRNIRCDYCGEYIGHSDDMAGHYDTRNGGEVTLHRNDYCNENWDKENPEPPLSLYVWREPLCMVCQKPITDEEKSASVSGGFVHFGADFPCYEHYEEAIDLLDATTDAA